METKLITDNTLLFSKGKVKCTKTLDTSLHFHRQIEIVYMKKGEANVTINKRDYKIKRGDFVVVNTLELHSIAPTNDVQFVLIVLPDSHSLSLPKLTSEVFQHGDKDADIIFNMHKQFINLDYAYQTVYFDLVTKLLSRLYNFLHQNDSKVEARIINYIAHKSHTKLTLDIVAAACATNRSYVSQIINKKFGINFNRYINKLRIAKFIDVYLDDSNNFNIVETSLAVGFADQRTFYRAFKDELHCSPKTYFAKK
ncbi:MAG: helix-turn-helix domain-containing protein [Bacillota bacterium]